jgi:hypothetical protein
MGNLMSQLRLTRMNKMALLVSMIFISNVHAEMKFFALAETMTAKQFTSPCITASSINDRFVFGKPLGSELNTRFIF